jgi:hypothetical protein
VTRPDKSNKKDLAAAKRKLIGDVPSRSWICPVQESDMFGIAYWNPATDPDKSGGLEKF